MTREEAIKEIKMWGIEAPKQRDALETLIPELRIGYDEKMRRFVKLILVSTESDAMDFYATNKITRKECTDWLDSLKLKSSTEVASSDDTFEACMLRYLNDAANRSSDEEIVKDTKEYKKQLLSIAKESLTQELRQKIIDDQFKISDRYMESDSLDFLVKYRHDGGDYSDWDELIPTTRVMEGEKYIDLCDLAEFLGV